MLVSQSLKANMSNTASEIDGKQGEQDVSLFDTIFNRNVIRKCATDGSIFLHISMQLFQLVYESRWTPELPQDFPQGLSVYGVKGLCGINKDSIQWDLLLNAFFLNVTIISIVLLPDLKPH